MPFLPPTGRWHVEGRCVPQLWRQAYYVDRDAGPDRYGSNFRRQFAMTSRVGGSPVPAESTLTTLPPDSLALREQTWNLRHRLTGALRHRSRRAAAIECTATLAAELEPDLTRSVPHHAPTRYAPHGASRTELGAERRPCSAGYRPASEPPRAEARSPRNTPQGD